MRARKAFGESWHYALIAITGLAFCVYIFDQERNLGHFFSADLLAPSQMFWNWFHGPDPSAFQLARIPSFVPDLAVYGLLHVLLDDYRAALVGYGIFQFFAFIFVGGWIVSRFTRRNLALCTSAVLLMILARTAAGAPRELHVFSLIEHFGAFLLSLAMAAALLAYLQRPARRWLILLGVGAFAGLLSNKLFLVEFLAPATGALGLLGLAGRESRRTVWKVLTVIWLASLPAPLIELLLPLSPSELPDNILNRVAAFFTSYPLSSTTGAALLMLASFLGFAVQPLLWRKRGAAARLPACTNEAVFIWLFAAFAMAGAVTFTAWIYTDPGSGRYLVAFYYWLVLFGAVALVQISRGLRGHTLYAALAACAAFLVVAKGAYRAPPLALTWRPPLAICLMEQQENLGLRAGLADYWLARPAMMGTDATIQVDQISGDGGLRSWMNNANWFARSIENPAEPPPYNFIVTHELDMARIESKYGAPDRTAPCGKYTLWIYDDRASLYAKLIKNAPRYVQELAANLGHSSAKAVP